MTEKRRFDVFISSTSQDLDAHRAAVRDVIIQREMLPVDMKDFEATSRSAVVLCKAEVERCDLFIGIYARRYGYIPQELPEGLPARFHGKSITEMEYLWAEDAGIDRLVFVLRPGAAERLPASHPLLRYADTEPQPDATPEQRRQAAEKQQKMQAFLAHVAANVVWSEFETPEALALRVSSALVSWEKERSHPALGSQKRSVRAAVAILVALTVLAAGEVLWRLFGAGALALNPVAALLGAGAALAAILIPRALFSLDAIRQTAPASGWLPALAQLLILLAFLGLRSPVLDGVSRQLIWEAVHQESRVDARRALSSARNLGADVVSPVRAELLAAIDAATGGASDDHALLMADLYAETGSADEALISDLRTKIQDAIADGQESLSHRAARVLLRLSPDEAAALANELNDRGAAALGQQDYGLARRYLETAVVVDQGIGNQRTGRAKSITRLNLGYTLENDVTVSDRALSAAALYREAIDLDGENVAAYYALSSLLLAAFETDAARLEEAREVSLRGQQAVEAAGLGDCRLPSGLSGLDGQWDCFLLLTTEAGARWLLGEGDGARRPLERALQLAEASGDFGPDRYTAEAYYYLARMTEPDTDRDILTKIVIEHNRFIDRHDRWACYANQQLGADVDCGR